MKVFKIGKGRFITRGIRENIPAVLVMYLWALIDERKANKEVPMDYLQVLELRPEIKDNEKNLIITLRQEQPTYEEVHSLTKFVNIKEKIYVIDDIDYVTMMLAEEY
ncbi:DUF960 family protein [Tissierella sp. Yu-01]|uniref:DUF960 family protein n=1 Tax=Tissierella sp. Yu-01 TaxID=3035694 RepID=UPI00240E8FAA|nr:DUF960 family protein [Tissierella sp. Yu-01]WFA09519.1 DUF960 family protein [Tissierella sp. Yu-01]